MRNSTTLVMTLALLSGPAFAHAAPAALPALPLAAAAPAADWTKLMAERSPALVTVKFVLKFEPASQEQETEITAVIIDASGLLLCSNTQTGGLPPLIQRQLGGMTATPTDIKVLIGEDTEGISAKLIARDRELDLAWIKIDDTAGKELTAVDFSKSTTPNVGDTLLTIGRLGKFFDRAPVVQMTRLGGTTKKPRKLYIPADESIAREIGKPVFAEDGAVIGFTALQLPEADDVEGGDMNSSDYLSAVILPAEDVVNATARALETAATDQGAATETPAEPAPK